MLMHVRMFLLVQNGKNFQIKYLIKDYMYILSRVAMAQGKQGIWFLLFQTGKTQGTLL